MMKHVVFARFPDTAAAHAAVDSVRRAAGAATQLEVRIFENEGRGDLADLVQQSGGLSVTDARRGALLGLLTGILSGAATGGIVFALVFEMGLGSVLGGVLLGALMGAMVGTMTSGIVGSGLTDRRLLRLAEDSKEGEVIVTFESTDARTTAAIESVVDRLGVPHIEKGIL